MPCRAVMLVPSFVARAEILLYSFESVSLKKLSSRCFRAAVPVDDPPPLPPTLSLGPVPIDDPRPIPPPACPGAVLDFPCAKTGTAQRARANAVKSKVERFMVLFLLRFRVVTESIRKMA